MSADGEAGATPSPEESKEPTALPAPPTESEPAEAATAVSSPGEGGEEPAALTPASAAGAVADVSPVALPRRRDSRLHRLLMGLLIALSCFMVVLSGVAIWAHSTVLNTDRYVAIVAPLAKDPKVLQELSDYVAAQVVTATDLQARVQQRLPERLDFLAVPIAAAVDDFISKQTYKVLNTEQAYNLWIKINRVAHAQIVALLRGESTYAYIQGNDVKLNTLPLISQVLVEVNNRLPGWLASRLNPPVIAPETPVDQASQQLAAWLGRPLPADAGQVTLLTSEALGPAQTAVKWMDRLAIILPIVTAVLIAVAIVLSHRRRRTIIELAIGVAVALIVLRVVLNRLEEAVVQRLTQDSIGAVVSGVVSASLGPLLDVIVWVVVGAVIVAVGTWLVGRADFRTAVVSASREVAAAGTGAVRSSTPALSWVGAHTDLLRIAGLIVGAILLLLFTWSWLWFIVWVGLIVAAQIVISWLARDWPFADGSGG